MQKTHIPDSRINVDTVAQAGLGSMIWRHRTFYLAANYYHLIVAIFTGLIVYISLWSSQYPRLALILAGLYVCYFIARQWMTPSMERVYYQPALQLLRAQAEIAALVLIVIIAPGVEPTLYWLLFLLPIMLTSKHCSTLQMIFTVFESCLAMVSLRYWYHPVWPIAWQTLVANADLATRFLWLGFLAFNLHYLWRNIQARDQTIAAYNAVNLLARESDMLEANQAKQWQPLLEVLVNYLHGSNAYTWICDYRTRELQLIAMAKRDQQHADQVLVEDGVATDIVTVPLDGMSLVASVARTGERSYSVSAPPKGIHSNAELAVPINIGSGQHTTIGVLCVEFNGSDFKESLLSEYQNFVEALINQSKPMLIYAKRLEELLALQEANQLISRNVGLDDVLDSILQAMIKILGFEFAMISLVDEDERFIRGRRGIHVDEEWLRMTVRDLISTDILAEIVRSGEREVITGWDSRFDQQTWNKFDHKEMIRVFTPIKVVDPATGEDRTLGVLEAGCRQSKRPEISGDQLRMLDAFQAQIGMAIDHAQLLERTQHRAEVLTSLHHVGHTIASASESTQVLNEVVRSAAELLNADIVMLYPYDPQKRRISSPICAGDLHGRYHLNLNLSADTILSRLLANSTPYYSADAQNDPLIVMPSDVPPELPAKPRITFIGRQEIVSLAGLPLIARGETVGIMFVNYRSWHNFGADERQTHELFAQQAAVAIKNVESNEMARELIMHQERYQLSRELHHSVSHDLSSIMFHAQNALNHIGSADENIHAKLTAILETSHEASNETAFIMDELRAPIEEGHNLIQGLQQYTERINRWFGIEVAMELDLRQSLPYRTEQVLIRVIREALNNAVRHSRCKHICVHCNSTDKVIQASVRDDGIGFIPTRVSPNRIGLKSMTELAETVGGKVTIESSPGNGTLVSLLVGDAREQEEP